jgi:hypothetical protein
MKQQPSKAATLYQGRSSTYEGRYITSDTLYLPMYVLGNETAADEVKEISTDLG